MDKSAIIQIAYWMGYGMAAYFNGLYEAAYRALALNGKPWIQRALATAVDYYEQAELKRLDDALDSLANAIKQHQTEDVLIRFRDAFTAILDRIVARW